MTERSIVEYFSGDEGYRCGYCKSDNTCYSHGMWAHTLTCLDYQNLIDRGWRRSGKYCYKPTMQLTCCPQYTIRCEAKKFLLSRSQKKVLKKVHKFLANGEKEKGCHFQSSDTDEQVMDVTECPEAANILNLKYIKNLTDIKHCDIETSHQGSLTCLQAEQACEKKNRCPSPTVLSNADSSHAVIVKSDTSSSNLDPNRIPCRKAKEIRRERKLKKLLSKGMTTQDAESLIKKKGIQSKSLEDFLSEPFPSEPAYQLKLRLVSSSLENSLFSQTFQESYSIYKKYQMAIHKDPADKCSQRQFIRFLVNNPFQECEDISPSAPRIYGSFHQQYWLNDSLIAVGVIDILPYCVSSVYFYYDPDYSFLSLGTYAALREVAFTRELNVTYPDIQYYYMGFYIHSCVKMRYKGQFSPSYLLCPETCVFQPIEKCKPKLDRSKYHRLEEDPNKGDPDGVVNLAKVLILYNKTQVTYPIYVNLKRSSDDEGVVREYAKYVGKKCYSRILLHRS